MDYIHELRKITGPRKLILNCAGAVIVRDDRILLQRRTDNGKWGLIGGLLEMNETYEEAALREIREETGLEVALDSFLGIFHNHDMVWPYRQRGAQDRRGILRAEVLLQGGDAGAVRGGSDRGPGRLFQRRAPSAVAGEPDGELKSVGPRALST